MGCYWRLGEILSYCDGVDMKPIQKSKDKMCSYYAWRIDRKDFFVMEGGYDTTYEYFIINELRNRNVKINYTQGIVYSSNLYKRIKHIL